MSELDTSIDMVALCRTLTSREKSKMLTQVIGNQQKTKTTWLRDVMKVRNIIMGVPNTDRKDQQIVKSGAFDMVVSMIEGEKA